uniref:N1-C protein n=1 Tax=Linum usitatissimum TaxID=4006 RepID=Q9ARB7_LINUS|nr:N1-C protein [Linum usitatissimum]
MMRSDSNGSTDSFPSCSSADLTPTSLPSGEYEIFLSFRGLDVRKTFADHLYTSLVRSKFRTFRDEEELEKGGAIGPSIIRAITESKIYIPILTPNYASSKWCLQELAKMVECWKSGGGAKGQHIILPVFLFVDPRDVRHTESGSYKEAFEQHRQKHDPETVLEWKEALQEVGKMKGYHVTESDGHGSIIDKILTEVELHLGANYTLVTDELVGIDSLVDEVVGLLNLDSSTSEKIIGIHGMGGLGKTTLAKAVYDKVSTKFERCYFLENIRDTLSEKNGVSILQNKIISGILRKDFNEAKNASDGIRIIRDRVCRHKLLIVLDDVDEKFQFDDVLGKLNNFSTNSRFLITTRDARGLELLQEYKMFELQEMSPDHSLTLFNKHAFDVDCPPKDYAILSKEFVQAAAGLPLYIKVIGSLLFRMDKIFWEEKLEEFKKISPTKVQERLKISYNELTYNEKQIFLDIACYFIGSVKIEPILMWNDCDLYPESTIRSLTQRSLIKLQRSEMKGDDVNTFQMHDHVRDLGRAIVREENNQKPYKRSRIWSNKDAIDMLKHKKGTDCVEVLTVDMEGEDLILTNKELEKLTRLRYLSVSNARLAGDFKDVLPNLRWLRLHSCDSVPTGLYLNKLVDLELVDCSVRDGWKGWNELKVAHKLKAVTLERCFHLKKVPDFSDCGDLEFLNFDGCRNMRGEVDIGNFKSLRFFQIADTKITKIKGEIGRLLNLKYLIVDDSSLKEVPAGISKLSSLKWLSLTLTDPYKLDFTEMLPASLRILLISNDTQKSCPDTSLENLQRLPNLSNLINLSVLFLMDVGIGEILGLGELKMLEYLIIERAPRIVHLDGLENLVLLQQLRVEGCPVLGKLPSLVALIRLEKLWIEDCPLVTEIHGVGQHWESLSDLRVVGCSALTGLDALHSMVKLEYLVLEGPELTERVLSSLSIITKLVKLGLWHMSRRQFPDLSNLKNLRELSLSFCEELIEVPGLDALESLEYLFLNGCLSIRKLPDLSGLKKLKKLDVEGCIQLKEVRGLERLESLEELNMSGCESIEKLPNLSGLKNLRELLLKGCTQLKEVNGLEGLELTVFEARKRIKGKYVMKSFARHGKQLLTSRSKFSGLFHSFTSLH